MALQVKVATFNIFPSLVDSLIDMTKSYMQQNTGCKHQKNKPKGDILLDILYATFVVGVL